MNKTGFKIKRIASLAVSAVLLITFMFSGYADAEAIPVQDISQEKLNLLRASGELPFPIGETKEITEDMVKIKKAEAEKISRSILQKLFEEEFAISSFNLIPYQNMYNSIKHVWEIGYYNKRTRNMNVNVQIDADSGLILNFNIWGRSLLQDNVNYIAKFTRKEAAKKVEDFMKNILKINIDEYGLRKDVDKYSFSLGGVKQPVEYNFVYSRKYKGAFVEGDNIYIAFDAVNGDIRHFNRSVMNFDSSRLTSPDRAISYQQALSKFKDAFEVNLTYSMDYKIHDEFSNPQIILGYVPVVYSNIIDAVSGKMINYEGKEIKVSDLKKQNTQPIPMNPEAKLESKPVSEKEASEIAMKYKKTVEQIYGISFDSKDTKFNHPILNSTKNNTIDFNWNARMNEKNAFLYLRINMDTGHVISMNINYEDIPIEKMIEEKKLMAEGKKIKINEKISWEEGRKRAIEYVKKLLPEQYGFYCNENIEIPLFSAEALDSMREYSYVFTRVVNGIRYSNNSIYLSINRETGLLRHFSVNWEDVDFPKADNIISKEEAMKRFFDDIKLELVYIMPVKYDEKYMNEKQNGNPMLAYRMGSKYSDIIEGIIDAQTGKYVNPYRYHVMLQNEDLDYEGDDLTRSIELLISQGILRTEGIKPDDNVTRAEAVKMMSLAKGMMYYYEYMESQKLKQTYEDVELDDPYYVFIENAVNKKILQDKKIKFNGNEFITAGEFIKLLVNLMGYGEIASRPEIFAPAAYSNGSWGLNGYVAVCQALKVLPVKEGEIFDANSMITYAQAAEALYKALEYVR